MSKVAKVDLKINDFAINSMTNNAAKSLFTLAYDIANQARSNAPYQTGALRNTVRVQEIDSNTIEVIAGGSYGGHKVPYAWIREQENKKNPDRAHYMEKAKDLIMSGNYIQKYFGDITK